MYNLGELKYLEDFAIGKSNLLGFLRLVFGFIVNKCLNFSL